MVMNLKHGENSYQAVIFIIFVVREFVLVSELNSSDLISVDVSRLHLWSYTPNMRPDTLGNESFLGEMAWQKADLLEEKGNGQSTKLTTGSRNLAQTSSRARNLQYEEERIRIERKDTLRCLQSGGTKKESWDDGVVELEDMPNLVVASDLRLIVPQFRKPSSINT